MEWAPTFELVGKVASGLFALAGAWWAVEKWRKRDEHFPRINFEVTANFIGAQDGKIVTEIVANLENKGVVPLKIKHFNFKLRGLRQSDAVIKGDKAVRGQTVFPHILDEGPLIPSDWAYSFVYPKVRTEYNFVTAIPSDVAFVRVQAGFEYLVAGETHHAAKILKVPDFAANTSATVPLPIKAPP